MELFNPCLSFSQIDGLYVYKLTEGNAMLIQSIAAKRKGQIETKCWWLDYNEDLGWNRLGFHQSEMQSVSVDRKVWRFNLELPTPQPSRKSR